MSFSFWLSGARIYWVRSAMSVSAALRALSIRGCVAEMTANAGTACDAALATWRRSGVGPRPCTYAGVDATGASLHLGHLQVILSLARMATAGLRPLLLLGGATALVGDPSGRRTERPILDTSVVASNAIELGKEARALWPRVLAADGASSWLRQAFSTTPAGARVIDHPRRRRRPVAAVAIAGLSRG